MLSSLAKKTYEKGEISILQQTVEASDIILELGTGVGLTSAYCATITGSDHVTTIEANINLKPFIQKLYTRNKVNPSLRFGVAGVETGEVTFYTEPNDIWSSSLLPVSPRGLLLQVNKINCNELLSSLRPSYLIMDIEGGEFDLIPSLDMTHISKIQIEIHAKLLGAEKAEILIDLLRDRGFTLHNELSDEEQYYFYRETINNPG